MEFGRASQISCRDWSQEEFLNCCKDRWKEEVANNNFKCYTIWWRQFFDPDAKECNQEEDLDEIVKIRLFLFVYITNINFICITCSKWIASKDEFPFQFANNPYKYGCPLPCFRSHYNFDCRANLEDHTYHNLLSDHDESHGGTFEVYSFRIAYLHFRISTV